MRCKEAEFWISLRIDGEEIPSGKCGPLDRHLVECASCRGILSQERERFAILGRSLGRPAGEEALLSARILAQAAAQGLERSRPSWGGTWLPASVFIPLAATFLVAAVGVGWWWLAPAPDVRAREPGYALLEQDSLDRDLYSTEAGEPVLRDTLKKRWTFSPVSTRPSGGLSPREQGRKQGMAGEVILDVERVDTRYFRFADFQYR
jgi:hypothetical protein